MRKLATVLIAFSAVVVLWAYLVTWPVWAVLAAGTAAVCALLFLPKSRIRTRIVLVLFGLFAGILRCVWYDASIMEPCRRLEGAVGTYRAVATSYSVAHDYGAATEIRLTVPGSGVYRAKLYEMTYGESALVPLEPGDELTVTAELHALRGDRTARPSDGIPLSAVTAYPAQVTGQRTGIAYAPARAAYAVKYQLRAFLPADAVPFLTALLTGDRTLFNEDVVFSDAVSTVSTAHIVAVSGMHVSFVAAMVYALLGHGWYAIVAAGGSCILFAALAGFTPSVTRACIMMLLGTTAPLFGRESDAPTTMSVALAALLLVDPTAIASASLQFSFAATAGIMLFTDKLYRLMIPGGAKLQKPVFKLPKLLASTASATVGASALTVPLAAIYYRSVSLTALPANLVVVPLAQTAFVLETIGLGLSVIWDLPAKLVGGLAALCVRGIRACCLGLARLPAASLTLWEPTSRFWLVYVYISLTGLLAVKAKWREHLCNTCLCAILLCAVLLSSAAVRTGEKLQLTALDVGQGQCVAILSRDTAVLVDCGGSDGGIAATTAAEWLRTRGRGKLDLLVLTHFHEDHTNGVEYLLALIPTSAVMMPEPLAEDADADWILELAQTHGCEVFYITQCQTVSFGHATMALYPPLGGEGENERGLSAVVSAGSFDALITGDMPAEQERLLVEQYALPDTELLVAGHHGSKHSTCAELLAAVTPEAAVISVGNNNYGHPAAETLARLTDMGITQYRTDESGSVTFRAR